MFGVLTKKREGFEGDQDGADEAGLQEELGRQEDDEDQAVDETDGSEDHLVE